MPLVGACAAPGPDARRARANEFEERLVATLPPDADPWWFTTSRGGEVSAHVLRDDAGAHLYTGGRVFGPYT